MPRSRDDSIVASDAAGLLPLEALDGLKPCFSSDCDGASASALVPYLSRELDNAGALTPVLCPPRVCYDTSYASTVVNSVNVLCSWQLLTLVFKLACVFCMVVFVTTACSALHCAFAVGVSSAAHSAGASAGSAIGWSLVQRALPLIWQTAVPPSSNSFVSSITGFVASVSQTPIFGEAKQRWTASVFDLVAFNLW
jgi:hypothetical protein